MNRLNHAVSVILPCRNEAVCIEGCLNAVLNQQPPDGGFEIIVADGMSDDGTREILQRLENGRWKTDDGSKPENGGPPDAHVVTGQLSVVSGPAIRVINNPGRIVPKGLNAAIRAARGDIIIRLDGHTEYASDYVCRCVEVLQKTGADNVGGPARTKADTFMQKAVAAAYHSPFAVGGARFHDPDYEGWVDTVTYGCWRRDVFERFGYFDEELVRNQDDEHNLRIIRGGGKIYQSPKIKSWYRPRGSLDALFKQYMQYGYWKVRVIQKHKLPASWRHLVPGAFVLALMMLFLLSAFSFLLSPMFHLPSPIFHLPAAAFLGTYALALLVASVVTAAKTEWKLLPLLPFVFPCYHFGYGYGFLHGVWDFVIRRRGPQKNFQILTR